jgi:DHA1 family bicyclomycin/chloramphenicol resistance-like MFS transporter
MSAITKERIPAGRLAVILGALATFGPFGTDMYLSGFPAMAQDLGSDVAGVQMSLSFYFIGLAIGQVIYGPLVDRVGRRVPLVCGLALFVVASACISFADSLGSLLFLRVLQALGGCSGMIVGRAVVRDLFDVRESAGILSMLAVVQGLGPIVAPVLGSQILTYASWRLVFVFLTLFGLGCLAAAYFGLPETLPPSRRRSGGAGEVLRDYGRLLVHRPFIVPPCRARSWVPAFSPTSAARLLCSWTFTA